MAAALLAAYPETFAGGAAVAGLPAGSASGAAAALGRMSHAGDDLDAAGWARRALALAPAAPPARWPAFSIWQGTADRVIDPANAANLEAQWRGLHGLKEAPTQDFSPRPG